MKVRFMPARDYTDVFNLRPSGVWLLLIRAHDHIWNDKEWSLEVRESARQDLLRLCRLESEKDLQDIERLQSYPL